MNDLQSRIGHRCSPAKLAALEKARRVRAERYRSLPMADLFWSKVDRRGPDECWTWLGGKHRGYGIFSGSANARPASRRAHRTAWELTNSKPFPRGKLACHTCDNPSCVNPAHIWPGTPKDNTRDMLAKGRCTKANKTHCVHGHEFTPENTFINNKLSSPARACRTCMRLRRAARKRERAQ